MNGQKFSLSFSKKIEKKSLQPSALGGESRTEVKRTPQALLAVDQDSLKVNENAEEEELVIPLLQAKRSAVLSRLAKLQQGDGGKEGEGKKEEETTQENQEDSKPLTLEEKAEHALLEESKRRLEEWTARDVKKDITIPIEDQLSAPLTDIGKESTLDDYDEIAVESFGAAILRGMGWKKSEGIGGREKKVIDIIDPSTKTLGSSEGKQTTTQKKEGEELGEDEEELPVVKGAYVFLHSGRHRGTYGVVEVVDEDHVLIRAAVGQAVLREVEGNLRVATQKEYRESSRVINKEMYDKFKEAEVKNNEAKKKMLCEEDKEGSGSDRDRKRSQKTRSKDRKEDHRDADSECVKLKQEGSEWDNNRKQRESDNEQKRDKNEGKRDEAEVRPRENSNKQSEKYRDRDDKRQRDRDEERQRRHREKESEKQRYKERKLVYSREERKDKYQNKRESDRKAQDPQERLYKDTQASGGKKRQEEFSEAQETKAKQQRMITPPWVQENLRVRIINKNYKGGKYHKQKVVVVSVVTAESCECVVDGGQLLDGVDPAWLETVIPKQPPMVVMVVRGRYNGQKGRILQLHKDQEKASIQLLEDETTILKLHYDDICEYAVR
ncbi:G-patch domain and KOW motifs-containing protein-like isoform X2 [Portunus trituberculatus]|uniref:G-patch domain and KOW motifs-containing protein-like isoform X2 n=1 Tax=Portunus trituberculatus TaxID=210409 RepID=UPI001E1CBE9E|nr:G-patch domain and KOW motifs-containing protein-like isoform X2 [Portunus trituberculatus]